jgi:hypothetical protein
MIKTSDLLEIQLTNDDNFLKIKETLTRIGIASKKDKTLYQSCHILHKQGRYYLVHFKEMFLLDGKKSDISEGDISRRNRIAGLLEEWDLIKVVDQERIDEGTEFPYIKIIPHKEKNDWNLESKYTIGKVKHGKSN